MAALGFWLRRSGCRRSNLTACTIRGGTSELASWRELRSRAERRLIERAGLRKHLPVWKAEHLSDPFSHQVASLFTLPPRRSPAPRTPGPSLAAPGATPSSARPYSLITRGLAWSSRFQVSRAEKNKKAKSLRSTSHLKPPLQNPSHAAPPPLGGTNKAALTSAFLFLLVPKLGLGGNKWAHQLA